MTSPDASTVVADVATLRWKRLALATGSSGLIGLVLLFAPIIAMSSLEEPPLDATRADAAAFIRNTAEAGWVDAASGVRGIGMLTILWFVVGLSLLLRRAEGEPPWRATIALVSGVLFAAYVLLDPSWAAAAHRGGEIDEPLAAYAFDLGNIGFINSWLAMASFSVAAGWVILVARPFARWIGWCAIISGAGLVVARFLWTVDGVWFAPYLLFWVWVVGICVQLLRRPGAIALGSARG